MKMVIKIYKTRSSDNVTKSVLGWLDSYQLSYEIMKRRSLTGADLKHILSLTDAGFEEIIVSSSRAYLAYRGIDFDFERSTIEQTIEFLLIHEELLRTPFIFDDTHLCIGFNKEDLRIFIPHVRNKKGRLRMEH